MTTYLGVISIRNKFVNFKPLYEHSRNEFHYLSQFDRQTILPYSQYGDINFYSEVDRDLASQFIDGEYVLFDYDSSELEDNYNSYGDRNPTGYKIDLSKVDPSRIRSLDEIGYCYVLSEDDIEGSYKTNPTLIIKDTYVYENLQVVIPLKNTKNSVIGPFTVTYREQDGNYVIKTGLASQKYIIWGYEYNTNLENHILTVGRYEDQKKFLNVNESVCAEVSFDLITKEQLISSFREALGQDYVVDGKLDLSNVGDLIKAHSGSLFVGDGIPSEIQEQRLDTLSTLLTDEDRLDDTFGFISDTITDLLEKYQGQKQYDDLLTKLADNPEFMERIQRYQIITSRIEEKEKIVQDLEKEAEAKRQQMNNQQQQEYADSLIDGLDDQIQSKIEKSDELDKVLEEKLAVIDQASSVIDLQKHADDLAQDIERKKYREYELRKEIDSLEKNLVSFLENTTDAAMRISFDGMLSNRLLQQAAKWESEQTAINYANRIEALKQLPLSTKNSEEIISYLVSQIASYRPNYDRNTILNILICCTQGFLTVFSGEPGTGKTSICKILGTVLGLTLPQKLLKKANDGFDPNRFIAVSVEKGWTTKRDFIGYYNPLTKTFDRSNRRIFDALQILDAEAAGDYANAPFMILLDEANLSPMEYYWADYMNICDDLDSNSVINLGDDFCFRVPEHLRFVATINNDHTTESLSPRLVDRAWVVRLPRVKSGVAKPMVLSTESVEIIPWSSMKSIFDVAVDAEAPLSGTAKEIYDDLLAKCKTAKINVSTRSDKAIRRYWAVAQKLFENDTNYGTDASIVALDFAVAQRILPHIDGSGEKFGEELKKLAKLCKDRNLRMSAEILEEIIQRGEDTMQYYQFFA